MQALKRVLSVVFLLGCVCGCICGGSGIAVAQQEASVAPRPLMSAIEAMNGGRWDRAADLAARAGPAAQSLIEWHRLRDGRGTPGEVLAFLEAHGDWPGLARLRARSEKLFRTARDGEVLAFYAGYRPKSGAGALRLADALRAAGDGEAAKAVLVAAWLTLDLSTGEHDIFITEHGALLKPHHAARLQMTLWRGLKDSALMLPLVSEERRAVEAVRQMARRGQRGLDAKIAALPEALRDEPTLGYARFETLLDRGRHEDAIALMIAQSRSEAGLGDAGYWSGWRRSLARRMMRAGEYDTAYELASRHGLQGGGNFADLEWLAGYLSLRFRDDAAGALVHFQQLEAAVKSPISRGRAFYWIGRAQEALGDGAAAQAAYVQGAAYPTSFYGVLAAEKAGVDLPDTLSGAEDFGDWRAADFVGSDVFAAGVLSLAAGQLWLAEVFFTHLADSLERDDVGRLGQALAHLKQPHLQVMVGKRAARRGIVVPGAYYALHPMTEMALPIDMEMALAIARRESEFDFRVRSGVGAEGLMQVMPGTARDVARDIGVAYQPSKMRKDWPYNAQLGAAYLAQMAERFDGNVVLVSAAYNAGPHRADRWIERFGDPRDEGVDVVDWIEHIPFRETRNYVQRVAESLPVYRARLGGDALPLPFGAELGGGSLTSTLGP